MDHVEPVPAEVRSLVGKISSEIIDPILAVIFAAALFYFLYGLMTFILSAGDESKRSDGKRHLMWGLVGMTVMVSVYALLNLGLYTLGVYRGTDYPDEIPLGQDPLYVP